jgi:hypothetical protein
MAMELPDVIRISMEVATVLENLGIPCLIGGSIVSSLYGHPRTTFDADLVADLRFQQIQPFAAALSADFYVEPERVADAVRRRASFNIIHHRTGLKVDIFILKNDPLARQEMARRQRVAPLPDMGEVPMATAEDIILQKLHWFQLGNRVSERQWDDVLGVLKVQRKRLDFDYLKDWARRIEVDDLLRQAYEDAGLDPALA